ncbi:hypothetical protein [Comamonas testosteroni]|jgi:hypothetical protein|uniref:Uncharacterized protein n=1 Tax=Comamonas testosteroni TaxID=285 RepID=A0A096FKF8_COMTE|nr:hypothetical protein [Comamonas testosteroni]KGH30851.1 hypothetical protein P353_08295 [Comamonas testosteroni]WKL18766.1 hypothetical protein QYQ99_27580 [Comamonas testosteroni]
MNDAHRKARLNYLIDHDYGRAAEFVRSTGISKARVSQMTSSAHPFGEAAARKLAQDLGLHEDWFNHTLPTPKEEQAGKSQPTTMDVVTSISGAILLTTDRLNVLTSTIERLHSFAISPVCPQACAEEIFDRIADLEKLLRGVEREKAISAQSLKS